MRLKTGSPVPMTGIYRVHHAAHTLPLEVTLSGNSQTFPKCSACDEPVEFELVRPTAAPFDFNIILHELPTTEHHDEEEPETEKAS